MRRVSSPSGVLGRPWRTHGQLEVRWPVQRRVRATAAVSQLRRDRRICTQHAQHRLESVYLTKTAFCVLFLCPIAMAQHGTDFPAYSWVL